MKSEKNKQHNKRRPFFLLVLCVVSFIYNGVLSSLFITSLFFPTYIQRLLNTYFTDITFSMAGTYAVLGTGLLLFGITFFGVLKMWLLQRAGFYIYLVSKLLLIIILFFSSYYSLINIGISVLLVIFYWSYLNKMS